MDNEHGPPQLAPTWSTQANASSSDGDSGSIRFASRSVGSDDVDMDEVYHNGADQHAKTTNSMVNRLEGTEESDALDEPLTVIDRGHASFNEVQTQGLGPMEDIDLEVFRVESRPLTSGSSATKDVVVCKYCDEEFPYLVRVIDQHKSTCEDYNRHREKSTDNAVAEELELHDVRDDEDQVPDDQHSGDHSEVSSTSSGASDASDGIERTDEEEDSVQDGGVGDQDSVGGDDNETQLLDSETPDPVPHRSDEEISAGGERDASDIDATTPAALADEDGAHAEYLAKPAEVRTGSDDGDKADEGAIGDMDADERDADGIDEGSVGHESTMSEVTGDDEAGNVSTPNSQYRVIHENRVECLYCENTFANRGSAKASHAKKCRPPKQTPQDRAATRNDAVLEMTPQKKSVKRRINQELEKLDGTVVGIDYTNPYGLRSHKRSKTETGVRKTPEWTVSTVAVAASGATAKQPSRSEVPDKLHSQRITAKRAEDPLEQFRVVGDTAQAKQIACKHCDGDIPFEIGEAEKHLTSCSAYKVFIGASPTGSTKRGTDNSVGVQANQKRSKASGMLLDTATNAASGNTKQSGMQPLDDLTVNTILDMDADARRTWLFGTPAGAEEMQRHFGVSPHVVRGCKSRFNAIVEVLFGLDVKKILETSAFGTQFTVATRTPPMNVLTFAQDAWFNYEGGHPIVFEAPEIIANMFIPQLADDVGCGPLVSADTHDVNLVCSKQPFKLDWRFDKWDTVVVCLQGKSLWKVKQSSVATPAATFVPPPVSTRERISQLMQQLAADQVGLNVDAFIPPTASSFDFRGAEDADSDEDMDDVGDGRHSNSGGTSPPYVVDAGAVVYLPRGTWYETKMLEQGPSMFLKIHLKSGGVGEVLVQTMRSLVSNSAWREREIEALKSTGPKAQQLLDEVVDDVIAKLQTLKKSDIVPQLWRGMVDARPSEVFYGEGRKLLVKTYEFDLTDQNGFRGGGDLHLLEGSMFRVSPLAFMFTPDEIGRYGSGTHAMTSSALVVSTAASKKALNRKQKRPASSAPGVASEFMFAWGAGDAVQVHVKFRCSKAQGVLIEWMRTRDKSSAFHVAQLKMLLAAEQDGTPNLEMLKQLLRFLHAIGYLTDVEVPL